MLLGTFSLLQIGKYGKKYRHLVTLVCSSSSRFFITTVVCFCHTFAPPSPSPSPPRSTCFQTLSIFKSQILELLSAEPEANFVPSGENATELTEPSCLNRECSNFDSKSRIVTILSAEPEANFLPSGENATDITQESCLKVKFASFGSAFELKVVKF